ncbi:hypothetical protein BV20DRAFT_1123590 [Pilatotrama ljubarskyi]|nr:hypothetical protein BV20DRAFT_1123590 [Pilatotrama ljubarskyi]
MAQTAAACARIGELRRIPEFNLSLSEIRELKQLADESSTSFDLEFQRCGLEARAHLMACTMFWGVDKGGGSEPAFRLLLELFHDETIPEFSSTFPLEHQTSLNAPSGITSVSSTPTMCSSSSLSSAVPAFPPTPSSLSSAVSAFPPTPSSLSSAVSAFPPTPSACSASPSFYPATPTSHSPTPSAIPAPCPAFSATPSEARPLPTLIPPSPITAHWTNGGASLQPHTAGGLASSIHRTNRDRELDDEDIMVGDKSGSIICQWNGCGASVKPIGLHKHIVGMEKGQHGGQITELETEGQKVSCQWLGCKSKPMLRSSLARHIKDLHLEACRVKCSRCGVCKRYDSYLSKHGPARYCTRAITLVSASGASGSRPGSAWGQPGPSTAYRTPDFLTDPRGQNPLVASVPTPASAIGPERRKGSQVRRAQTEHAVAYPRPLHAPRPVPGHLLDGQLHHQDGPVLGYGTHCTAASDPHPTGPAGPPFAEAPSANAAWPPKQPTTYDLLGWKQEYVTPGQCYPTGGPGMQADANDENCPPHS